MQLVRPDGKFHSRLTGRYQVQCSGIRRGGVMPTDYDKRLSPDEFKDLLAFLTRQGTKPAAAGNRGGEE